MANFGKSNLRKFPLQLISEKIILFLLPIMQKKIQFFQLFLFIPVLFWLVAKPISLVKTDDAQIKTEKNQKTFQVAEQHVYQVSSSTNVDFPQDFVFPSVQIFSVQAPQLAIKLPSVIHRTQFMRILLTQFIATLAP